MNVPSVPGADPCIAMVIILAVLGPGWHLRLTDRGGGSPTVGAPPAHPAARGRRGPCVLGAPCSLPFSFLFKAPRLPSAPPPKETWVFRVHKNPAVLTVKLSGSWFSGSVSWFVFPFVSCVGA